MNYVTLAYEIAKEAHKGQIDKAGVEYILHPKTVAGMMNCDNEKAVAYLHDVIEDTSVTLEMLKDEGFSDEVLNAIDAITKRNGEKYDDYLQRVANNPLAIKVKLVDMTHNSDLTRFDNHTDEDFKRSQKYIEKIKELKKVIEEN